MRAFNLISAKKNLHSLSNRHPPQTRYRQQMIFRNLLWFSIKYVISVECHMDEILPQFFDAHFFRIHLTLSQIFMSCIQCVKLCFFSVQGDIQSFSCYLTFIWQRLIFLTIIYAAHMLTTVTLALLISIPAPVLLFYSHHRTPICARYNKVCNFRHQSIPNAESAHLMSTVIDYKRLFVVHIPKSHETRHEQNVIYSQLNMCHTYSKSNVCWIFYS